MFKDCSDCCGENGLNGGEYNIERPWGLVATVDWDQDLMQEIEINRLGYKVWGVTLTQLDLDMRFEGKRTLE